MKIGNIDVSKLFIGGTAVSKAYLGATEVYTAYKPIPNNEIWYTTTDGNPIADTVLQYNHTFDASGTALTLQSNTYKGGKGVLSYSGDIVRIEGQDNEDDYLGAFQNSNTLTGIEFPKTVSKLEYATIVSCPYVETVVFNSLVLDMGTEPLWVQNNSAATKSKINSIVFQAATAPTITTQTFMAVAPQGTLYYPTGSDYSTVMTALESAQWKGKAVDDFSKLFYGMKTSPSSLTLNPNQIDTKLYVKCSEDYSLSAEGDIKDYILLPVGGGDADLTGAKTAFTVALKDINLAETKTGTITVKSASYSKTVPVTYYPTPYKEELEWIGNGEYNDADADKRASCVIDTGYIPNINTKVKLKIATKYQPDGTLIFGYYTSITSNDNQYWRFFKAGEVFYFDCPNDGDERVSLTLYDNTNKILDFEVGNMYMTCTTTNQNDSNKTLTANTWNNSLCFFGCVFEGGNNYGNKGIKFYNTQIYEGETLVKDFIPVLDFNNKPCMYEKIGKTFHYNTGKEELTYGRKTTA